MERSELIKKIEQIEHILPHNSDEWTGYICDSFFITSLQFVRHYLGIDSEFYKILSVEKNTSSSQATSKAMATKKVLKAIKDYLNLELELFETEKYIIKVDIINDFIIQAIELLNDKKIHPVAPAILMGAALEEFLKKLAEKNNIDVSDIKKTIDPLSKKLYSSKIISKQDLKDITSWAGIRNDATHGNFEEVDDRKRIANALEGVNLFMRKSEQ